MADYANYLPQTPALASFIGISPAEQAQLQQYASPDISGRRHPMGGLALAGRSQREEGFNAYLQSLQAGNVWRQQQMERAINANLKEAATNQMGRIVPQLLRSGDTRMLAGSQFAGDVMPGITNDQGGASDMSVEADTNARAISDAARMKDVAESANQMQLAGETPETQALANTYGLPLTKSQPTAVQVAALNAAARRSSGGGKPLLTSTRSHYEHDAQGNAYLVSDRIYGNYGGGNITPTGNASASAAASPAASAASPSVSANALPVPPGFTPMNEEDLDNDQSANAQEAIAEAQDAGYTPLGFLSTPDGSTILVARGAAGDMHKYNLDEMGGGSGPPTVDNAGNETGQ